MTWLIDAGARLLAAAVLAFVGLRLIRAVRNGAGRSMERAGMEISLRKFLDALLYALLLFSIATQFGVTEASVAALIGSAGLTLGLGLQGSLSNLAGGVLILIFKPFLVGDYIIEHGTNCEGTVVKIEMCYTTLSTVDNKRIVIPNGTLSNNSLTNVTAKDRRRLEMKVGISYESDMKKPSPLWKIF